MGFFSYLTGFGGPRHGGVDLGTANTLVYVRGRGSCWRAVGGGDDPRSGQVLAVGLEAKRMPGRTPDDSAIRPLKDGVIADSEVTEEMLRYFIEKADENRWSAPRVVVCVPFGVKSREARGRGGVPLRRARQVYLIEEPRPPHRRGADGRGATGNMVVDIGGGTSEVAVSPSRHPRLALDPIGGDAMDEAIINDVSASTRY